MDSLKDSAAGPVQPITIRCYNESTKSFITKTWTSAYPFYTLDDLKLNIYLQQGQDTKWIPSRVFVGISEGEPEEGPADTYMPLDYVWYKSAQQESGIFLQLKSPLKVCTTGGPVDINFVDSIGSLREVAMSDRGRATLEDAFIIPRNGAIPTFYAFCFDDMLQRVGISNGRPIEARTWNGRFIMYFPQLRPENYAIGEDEIADLQRTLDYKQVTKGMLNSIESSLESGEPTASMQVTGVLALQLTWPENLDYNFEGGQGVEALFYRIPVNKRRPFMRLMPSNSVPVTKIHTQGAVVPIPDIADPNLILQWAKEVSPNSNEDYLFIKVLTSPIQSSLPVYSTIRVFQNGSADAIILPSKQQRELKPESDLRDIDLTLGEAIVDIPHLNKNVLSLGEVTVALNMSVEKGSQQLTLTRLRGRVALFSYFFQEVPAFDKKSPPIILIKYKAISQFATEKRIFSFISQWLKGRDISAELVLMVAKEFDLSTEAARQMITQFLRERDTFTVLAPEINSFSETNAAGIDIAIYGPHPNYRIEIYKCNSEITLRRIYTLLSMMLKLDFSVDISPESVRIAAELEPSVESAVHEDEAEAAMGGSLPIPSRRRFVMPVAEEEAEVAPVPEVTSVPKSRRFVLPTSTEIVPPLQQEEEEEEEEEDTVVEAPEPVPKSRRFVIPAAVQENTAIPSSTAIVPLVGESASPEGSDVEEEAAVNSPEGSDVEEEVAVNSPEEAKPKAPVSARLASLMVDDDDEASASEEEESAVTAPAVTAPVAPPPKAAVVTEESDNSVTPPPAKPAVAPKGLAASLYFDNSNNNESSQDGGGPGDNDEDAGAGRDWPAAAKGWFIKQLKKIDPRLFEFKPKLGSDNSYTRKCQANAGQQPMVLTQREYEQMREEYENDKNLTFIVYPLSGAEVEPPLYHEIVTVMKYGSDPSNLNYYFCPELFCLRDRIMVRRIDFEGTEWRTKEKTGDKLRNRCPFCGGKEIDDQREYKAGYTVFRRPNKPKADKPQTFIGFVEPTTHPENFQLPCCYLGPRTEGKTKKFAGYITWASDKGYKLSDSSFATQRQFRRRAEFRGTEPEAAAAAAAEEQKKEEEEEEDTVTASYEIKLNKLVSEYIKDPGHSLEMAQFGAMQGALDAYFGQVSGRHISRKKGNKQELVDNAKVFIRMGVEKKGLFGALAPYLKKNSAEEVRQIFIDNLSPVDRFLSANFGNLVNEFYEPTSDAFRPESDNDLAQFALQIKTDPLNYKNKPDLTRLFMSYYNFMDYLGNSKAKEFRIFAPILAYPGLITERGLILILIDYDRENPDAPLNVKCPPFGYQPNIHDGADFAFLLRDKTGSYEAVVYAEKFKGDAAGRSRHTTALKFQVGTAPPVANARHKEFAERCVAPNSVIYTSQRDVSPKVLLSYSQVISPVFREGAADPNNPGVSAPQGVIRDAYNHIVGVVFQTDTTKSVSYTIPFPVIDNDGYIPQGKYIYFDWSSLYPSHVNTILKYYFYNLAHILVRYPGYTPVQVVRDDNKNVRAIQLANGIFIPARGKMAENTVRIGENELPVVEVKSIDFEPEWVINRTVMFGTERDDETKVKIQDLYDKLLLTKREKIEELYQHFRMSVANWLNSEEVSSTFKRELEDIIFPRITNDGMITIPMYEKRKRLLILLDSDMRSWFIADEGFLPTRPSFFRRDCRAITDAGSCNEACKWKGDGADGQCLLHVPTQVNIDEKTVVSTIDLFIRRVIDELISFPVKRKELFNRKVRSVVDLKKAIHIGDQWIVPENTATWLQILSLSWTVKETEQPKFYEEQSATGEAETAAEEEELEPEADAVIQPVPATGLRRRRVRPPTAGGV